MAASKAIVFSMMVEELPSFIFGGCLRLIFTSHKIRLVLSEATPKQLQEEGGRSKTNNNNKLKNVKVEAVRLLTNYLKVQGVWDEEFPISNGDIFETR